MKTIKNKNIKNYILFRFFVQKSTSSKTQKIKNNREILILKKYYKKIRKSEKLFHYQTFLQKFLPKFLKLLKIS